MPELFSAKTSKKAASVSPQSETELTVGTTSPELDSSSMHTPMIETPVHQATAQEEAPHKPKRHVDEYSDTMRIEAPTNNPFQAFAPKPASVFFDSQLRDEKVLLLLRRHPVTQIPWILTAIVMIFLPFLIAFAFPFLNLLPAQYQFAGTLGWYALVFSFILESFLMWFFNAYIITDERVIDVDFTSLIYKNISAAKIDNIEDITATTGGALRSLFDYGTIKIQTAAATTEFEFEDVPHPGKVASLINELLVEEEREKVEGRTS
jgi:hypothetical protein